MSYRLIFIGYITNQFHKELHLGHSEEVCGWARSVVLLFAASCDQLVEHVVGEGAAAFFWSLKIRWISKLVKNFKRILRFDFCA